MSIDVDKIVSKFLGWKLPADFSPDAGISFKAYFKPDSPHWPFGTNLLNALQAKAMIEHMLEGAITSMQTEQPVTREEIINIAEKAGAYVGGNYPQLIDGNHQVKVFEYTKKVIELVRSTNIDGWVLTLIDDDENRTYKFYSLKNALTAQQDWLEQGIKSTIHPAPVTSMQESISEECTSEPLKIAMDALKFYADKSSYDCDHDIGMEVSHRVILYKDQYEHNQQTYYAGKRAIEALEAIDSQLSTNTDGWVSVPSGNIESVKQYADFEVHIKFKSCRAAGAFKHAISQPKGE